MTLKYEDCPGQVTRLEHCPIHLKKKRLWVWSLVGAYKGGNWQLVDVSHINVRDLLSLSLSLISKHVLRWGVKTIQGQRGLIQTGNFQIKLLLVKICIYPQFWWIFIYVNLIWDSLHITLNLGIFMSVWLWNTVSDFLATFELSQTRCSFVRTAPEISSVVLGQ